MTNNQSVNTQVFFNARLVLHGFAGANLSANIVKSVILFHLILRKKTLVVSDNKWVALSHFNFISIYVFYILNI